MYPNLTNLCIFPSFINLSLFFLSHTRLSWMNIQWIGPWKTRADSISRGLMSPGMGPIINCCSGDHLGSGKGSEDLNFHLCSLHLFICSKDDPGSGRGQLDLDLYFLLMSSLNLRIGFKISALPVMMCLWTGWGRGRGIQFTLPEWVQVCLPIHFSAHSNLHRQPMFIYSLD